MTHANSLKEISFEEMEKIDGGVVIFGVTVAGMTLLKIEGACPAACITAGITVVLNNKNRTSK